MSISHAPQATSSALEQAIDSTIAANPSMKDAHWGLVVQDDSGKVLYQNNADQMFLPASNLKLVTAATATSVLGKDKQFTSRLATTGTIDANGVLHGNLYLLGGGDPSLTTADLQKAIKTLPFRSVDGNVVVDDSVFDATRSAPGWVWDDLSAPYGAEIDGLTLDENTAQLDVSTSGVSQATNYLTLRNQTTRGTATDVDGNRELGTNVVDVTGTVAPGHPARFGVSVHDPALYAGTVLQTLLQHQGISVSGQVTRGTAPSQATDIWQKSSDKLIDLETHMLKESDNLYAETLFRAMAGGSSAAAPGKEKQVLGFTSPTRIVDGSGLSRYDLVSPRLLSDIIQKDYRDKDLRAALPVAGVDGTLRGRMPALKGRVQAKTGTMGDVSTLTGWLVLKDGRQVSFSFMTNGYPGPISQVEATQDAVLEAMDKTLS